MENTIEIKLTIPELETLLLKTFHRDGNSEAILHGLTNKFHDGLDSLKKLRAQGQPGYPSPL